MTANVKRKLFHILNERARREQRQREAREEELFQEWAKDPRKSHGIDMIRNYPLIDEE